MFRQVSRCIWELTCHKSDSRHPRVVSTCWEASWHSQTCCTHKKRGPWRGYQESVCNWKLQENFFSSFQIHRILPKREQNFFFFVFFEMCNCVKLLWFQIYTEIWNHLVFIQTNSNWRTSSLSWEHICTKKPTFPNSLTYKRLGPVELTNCAEASGMLSHLFHFIQGWLLAFTDLGTRWEIKKKKMAWYLFCALKELFWIFEEPGT